MSRLKAVLTVALNVYGASVGSFLFTIFVLPRIHLHASPQSWVFFAYGMAFIGFTTLVDLGAGQIVPREIARSSPGESKITVRQFHSLAAYSALAFLVIFIAASSSTRLGSLATNGMILLYGMWIATSSYYAFLVTTVQGYKLNAEYSRTVLVSTFLKSLIILILLRSPIFDTAYAVGTILVFMILEVIVYRRLLRSKVALPFLWPRQAFAGLRHSRFWMRTIGISSGGLVAQADRLTLIRILSPSDYGKYILLSTFALLFLALEYPVLRYVTPRLRLRREKILLLVGFVLLGITAIGAAFVSLSVPLFEMWSGARADSTMRFAIWLLCVGMAIQANYNFVYLLLVLDAQYKAILGINIAAFFVVLLTAVFLIRTDLGIKTGGLLWIIASSVQIILALAVLRFASRAKDWMSLQH